MKIENITADKKKLVEEVKVAKLEIKRRDKDLNDLATTHKQVFELASSLKKEKKGVDMELESRGLEIEDLTKQIRIVRNQLSEKQNQEESNKEEIVQLKECTDNLIKCRDLNDAEIKHLKQEIEALSKKKSRIANENMCDKESQEKEIFKMKEKLLESETRVKANLEELSTLRVANEKMEQENEGIQK